MISSRWEKNSRSSESGQALVFLVLALALVFLGAGALSVDMSNLWFHRQAAQNRRRGLHSGPCRAPR